jgi:hypothetical protein
LPNGPINKGEYIDAFAEYKDKYYIANHFTTLALSSPDQYLYPNIAYGIKELRFKFKDAVEKYKISTNEPMYYLCVQRDGYDCKAFAKALREEFAVNIKKLEDGYSIVEFPYDVYMNLKPEPLLGSIEDESFVEIALNLLNGTDTQKSLESAIYVRSFFISNKPHPYFPNANRKEMFDAFKEFERIIINNNIYDRIEPNVLLEYRVKYPNTWNKAIIIAFAKLLAKQDKEEFCQLKHLNEANEMAKKITI